MPPQPSTSNTSSCGKRDDSSSADGGANGGRGGVVSSACASGAAWRRRQRGHSPSREAVSSAARQRVQAPVMVGSLRRGRELVFHLVLTDRPAKVAPSSATQRSEQRGEGRGRRGRSGSLRVCRQLLAH